MEPCLQCQAILVGSGHLLCPKCSLISRADVSSMGAGKMVKIAIVPKNPVPSEFPDELSEELSDNEPPDSGGDQF